MGCSPVAIVRVFIVVVIVATVTVIIATITTAITAVAAIVVIRVVGLCCQNFASKLKFDQGNGETAQTFQ